MAKKILFDADARTAIKRGIDIAARAVKVTLGPRGRNVILDKGYGGPHMTNDGVTIAKEISLRDKFENMGAEIVKEVANKTNDLAGDGTTTSVVLFQALVEEGMKHTQMGVRRCRRTFSVRSTSAGRYPRAGIRRGSGWRSSRCRTARGDCRCR